MRPHSDARRKPRHNMIIGGKRTPGGLMARSPGGGKAFPAGVRSPPLRGMAKRRRGGLTGANPEMTRGAFFSEGRTPCVRVARPCASRGIPFPPDGLTIRRWPRGHMPRSSRGLPCGRAEPAPPRNGQAKARRPYGGKPGDDAEGGFLGGTHSVRPPGKAIRKPRHNMIIGSKGTPGALAGTCSGEANSLIAGVRSPPLQGWTVQGETASRGKPSDNREVVLSEGRTPCVRLIRPCSNQCTALIEEDAARPVA